MTWIKTQRYTRTNELSERKATFSANFLSVKGIPNLKCLFDTDHEVEDVQDAVFEAPTEHLKGPLAHLFSNFSSSETSSK